MKTCQCTFQLFFVNDDISSRNHDEFQIKHKRTCQPFKVFMLKINFTTISIKSNTKFKMKLIRQRENIDVSDKIRLLTI